MIEKPMCRITYGANCKGIL